MRARLGIVAATAALLAMTGLYVARWALESRVEPSAGGRVFVVEAGQSVGAVAQGLAKDQVLSRPWLFKLAAFLSGTAARIQAGEYRVRDADTHRRLLERMGRGEVVQHYFTIIEGWAVIELLAALRAEKPLVSTLASGNPEDLADELGLEHEHAEGLFFPDTYAYTRGETDAELLLRSHALMQEKLLAAWDGRADEPALNNSYEMLILASIVERETALDAERAVIAGVLTRRLTQRMRLQVDPTVIYGLGQSYSGDITRAHLRNDTPYNTYTRHGLPPTPISLPGQASLQAAAKPQSGSYLYYVASANLDGTHVFSDTLAEHNAAVSAMLRSQRTRQGRQ